MASVPGGLSSSGGLGMALEGPQIRYAGLPHVEEPREDADAVARALRLARQVEELLENTPSLTDPSRAHSTRMARAMAASLVDELEAIAAPRSTRASVPPPKSGVA